jgi:hypothetical protein
MVQVCPLAAEMMNDNLAFPTESKILNTESLNELADRNIAAIRIKNFYEIERAKTLGKWLVSNTTHENYRVSDAHGQLKPSEVKRVGIPLNEIYNLIIGNYSTDQLNALCAFQYLAMSQIERIREATRPAPTPVDQVRLSLDEAWSHGARWARFGVVRPFIGLIRLVDADDRTDVDPEPHIDCLPPQIHPFRAQLSAIVYLEMPPAGGELEIWHDAPAGENGTLPHHLRNRLPPPLKLRPNVGDLIIINTRVPHAVRGFSVGKRIVQTCFIGLDEGRPLSLWS